MPRKNLLLALALGLALAVGVATALRLAQRPDALAAATLLPAPVELPAFRLLDQDGEDAGPDFFRGRWNLLFFGFTNCPDVCPLTLQTLAMARQELPRDGDTPLPRLVLVSVDPQRDTPERLAAYVRSFGDDVVGLTGEPDEIRRLADAFGVYFARAEAPPGGNPDSYGVDHSAVVIVVGPDARYRALFTAPFDRAQIVHDLALLFRS